jgi:hypothetical protein
MNSNIFNIDYNRLVRWLIPPALRQENTIAWLRALVKPSVIVYHSFRRYRRQKLYELMITGQVCYLERLLNDKYDYTLRRIRIVDSVDRSPVVFYQEDEQKPVVFYQEGEGPEVVFYTEGEAGNLRDDFIIEVPLSIVFITNEMIELVKIFKLAGTIFSIQRV